MCGLALLSGVVWSCLLLPSVVTVSLPADEAIVFTSIISEQRYQIITISIVIKKYLMVVKFGYLILFHCVWIDAVMVAVNKGKRIKGCV